jgi:UDP-N-acetylmuramoylalanine-D-glutamate ligase
MESMRVYVAGPYTGDEEANVQRAIAAGHALMDAGFAPFVPHLSHFSEAQRPRHYEDWMGLDLAWLLSAHAVLRLPGASAGADREVAQAHRSGIPVFTDIEALARHRDGVVS